MTEAKEETNDSKKGIWRQKWLTISRGLKTEINDSNKETVEEEKMTVRMELTENK